MSDSADNSHVAAASHEWQPPYRLWWRDALLVIGAFAFAGALPRDYSGLVMVAGMLYVPVVLKFRLVGMVEPVVRRNWAVASAGILMAFVGVVSTYSVYNGKSFVGLDLWALLQYAFSTSVGAAIPEELFFRGFLWQRWERGYRIASGHRWWLPSVTNLKIATVFAFVHVVADGGNVRRLDVFVPALWYGAMVERGASLPLAMVVHALSNVAMYAVLHGYGWREALP